jgi:hypothetical protein
MAFPPLKGRDTIGRSFIKNRRFLSMACLVTLETLLQASNITYPVLRLVKSGKKMSTRKVSEDL